MRTAFIIVILLLLGAIGLLIWQRHQGGAPPTVSGTPPAPPVESEETQAARALVSYLRAVYEPDYERAYDFLSAASRRKHSLEEFADACRQGVTDFDLSAPPTTERKDGAIAATLPLAEEPGAHSFLIVREEGGWKVVYLSGRPTFPYP